jgi:hypothetical protein
MHRDEMFEYQDDAANPSMSEEESAHLKEENARVREEVSAVLEMPGYTYLHRMFVDGITSADEQLRALSTSDSTLRYWQGYINALMSVQKRFVSLAKAEEERNV